VLNPQIAGDATFPGEETTKESMVQSPIEFPKITILFQFEKVDE
jgi:hypothetical protein